VDVSLRGLHEDAQLQATDLEYDGRDLVRKALKNEPAELSIVLCDDAEIMKLNAQWRDRESSLRDELRILLLHGVLHLMGFDHEKSEAHLRVVSSTCPLLFLFQFTLTRNVVLIIYKRWRMQSRECWMNYIGAAPA